MKERVYRAVLQNYSCNTTASNQLVRKANKLFKRRPNIIFVLKVQDQIQMTYCWRIRLA